MTVPIALNDSDPDGDPLTYSITSAPEPALGTRPAAERISSCSTPPRGAVGTAASSGTRSTTASHRPSATVTITVLPCVVGAARRP